MGRARAVCRLAAMLFAGVVGCAAPAGRWAGVADRWQQVAAYYDAGCAGSAAPASAAPRPTSDALSVGTAGSTPGQRATEPLAIRAATARELVLQPDRRTALDAAAEGAAACVVHVAVTRQRPDKHESGSDGQPTSGASGGTGIVIDARGLVLTNAHVVRDAEHVTICCADGQCCAVEQIATDDAADLALLRVTACELNELKVAPATTCPGTAVIALGRPAPHAAHHCHGRVTSASRSLANRLGGSAYANLIESSAVPQPGFSGGPLLDEHGHWVGVNVALARQDGEVRGYAIPLSPEVCRTISRLVAAVAPQFD